MSKEFSLADVAKHASADDCWVVLGEPGEKKVYDVSKFLDDHPGGPEIVLDKAGEDSHTEFEDIGHSQDARDQLEGLLIGKLKESAEEIAAAKEAARLKAESSGGSPMIMLAVVAGIGAIAYSQLM